MPRQLFGYGRSDRSSKLSCGLLSETTTGFRSRRGCGHDLAPVTPHNAPFASYKTTPVHHAAWRRGSLAAGGAFATDLKSRAYWFSRRKHALGRGGAASAIAGGTARPRLHRGAEHLHRLPLGRGELLSGYERRYYDRRDYDPGVRIDGNRHEVSTSSSRGWPAI